jgi:hypothetical protein
MSNGGLENKIKFGALKKATLSRGFVLYYLLNYLNPIFLFHHPA